MLVIWQGWESSLLNCWPLEDTNVSTSVCSRGLQFTYNPFTLMWRKYIWKSFGVAFDCLSEAEHKRRSMVAWWKSYNWRCWGQPLNARIHFVRKGLPGSLVKTRLLPKGQRKEENIPSHLRRGFSDRKIISFWRTWIKENQSCICLLGWVETRGTIGYIAEWLATRDYFFVSFGGFIWLWTTEHPCELSWNTFSAV